MRDEIDMAPSRSPKPDLETFMKQQKQLKQEKRDREAAIKKAQDREALVSHDNSLNDDDPRRVTGSTLPKFPAEVPTERCQGCGCVLPKAKERTKDSEGGAKQSSSKRKKFSLEDLVEKRKRDDDDDDDLDDALFGGSSKRQHRDLGAVMQPADGNGQDGNPSGVVQPADSNSRYVFANGVVKPTDAEYKGALRIVIRLMGDRTLRQSAKYVAAEDIVRAKTGKRPKAYVTDIGRRWILESLGWPYLD